MNREWGRKLEKKSKRMQGRLAVMERNIRENRRAQKQRSGPGQDFFNLTLELQSQEERLAALQAQRDELLLGLRGLQESLKNQALRVNRLEKRLEEGLQRSGDKNKGVWSSNITPQEYYGSIHRGRRPGEVVDEHTQTGYFQEQLQSGHHHTQLPASHQRNPHVQNLRYPSQHQAPPQPEPTKDRQSRISLDTPHHQTSDAPPQPQSESKPQSENDSKGNFSVIHSLLQLPVRQKIPAQPAPIKDATSK